MSRKSGSKKELYPRETTSGVYNFVNELEEDLIRSVVASPESLDRENEFPDGAAGVDNSQEDLKELLDGQNVVVNRLKTQLKRVMNESGSCEEAVIEELRRELDEEVRKLEYLVDHIIKHNRVLHVQETFNLASALEEENASDSFDEKQSGETFVRPAGDDFKDRVIDCLKKKVGHLEGRTAGNKVAKKQQQQPKNTKRDSTTTDSSLFECRKLAQELGKRERDVDMVEMGIDSMTTKLEKMREVCCPYRPQKKKSTKCFQNKNYSAVVSNLAKKDKEVRDLSMKLRVKKYDEKPAAEAAFLREMCEKQNSENFTLKAMVREQNSQLKVYQQKYLNAHQLSEERMGMMRKMQQKADQMDETVRCEISHIRKDFQMQNNSLNQQIRKLSAERDRLKEECKRRRTYQEDLSTTLTELERLQREEKNWQREKKRNLPGMIQQLQEDLQCLIYKNNQLLCERDAISEKLSETEAELENHRKETVEIINRTNFAANEVNKSLRKELSEMEKYLAECRAATKIALADRDACILSLQSQISVADTKLQEVKLQMENVRGHITLVTDKVTGGTKTICKACKKIL